MMNTVTEAAYTITATEDSPIIEKILFSWIDHTFFFLLLGVSALVGIYFGFFNKKQNNVVEYILGGKSMRTFPVAVSLVSGVTSGITILGVPADIYKYGASYWLCTIAFCLTGVISMYIYIPVFYKLQLISSYEYLKIRFSNRVRVLASFLYVFSSIFFYPIIIYIPALAYNQVTEVSVHLVTPIVCTVSIFYTTLGGLKAIIWTDTLQFCIMIIVMLVTLFLQLFSTDNIGYIFTKSFEDGRLNLWDFDIDPTNRTSFWSVVLGLAITWTSFLGVCQTCVQKYLALPNIEKVKKAIIMSMFGKFVVISICCVTALAMYAKYSDCDPVKTGLVQKVDQIFPYFIMDVARQIPGLPGLFIAGIFCAALSTMSAGLHTLSLVIYEDYLVRFMPKTTTQTRASNIIKLMVILFGIFNTSMVLIIQELGSILPLAVSFQGMSSGPLLGIFTLGMLFPFANEKGAIVGAFTGLFLVGFVVFGTIYHNVHGALQPQMLPTSTESCNHFINTTIPEIVGYTPLWIFRISFYYYTLIGVIITVVVGIIISLLTDGWKQNINKDLLSPVIHSFLSKKKESKYRTVEHAMTFITKNHEADKEEENFLKSNC